MEYNSFSVKTSASGFDCQRTQLHDYGMEGDKRVAEKRRRRGFVVTEGDIDILKFLHDFRLLRIEHVALLTGRSYTRVHRRLKGLLDSGLLRRIEAPQTKDIYHLGKPGLERLLLEGLITEEEALRRNRSHELRPATLAHEMMIADIHIALELCCRDEALKLFSWEEGESIRDTFEAGGMMPRKIVVQPDAFFQLKDTRFPDGQNRRSYFLEADRSTMGTKPRAGSQRFRDKIERYRWFIDTSRAFERHRVKSIRIVTLTLTAQRRDNLCTDTDAYLRENDLTRLRKFFLFASMRDVLSEAAILGPVFKRPGDSGTVPLFPALPELRASA